MYQELCIKLAVAEMELKRRFVEFLYDEDGEVNIIAMIVILAIAIALAVVFRTQIKQLFDRIWGAISQSTGNALQGY